MNPRHLLPTHHIPEPRTPVHSRTNHPSIVWWRGKCLRPAANLSDTGPENETSSAGMDSRPSSYSPNPCPDSRWDRMRDDDCFSLASTVAGGTTVCSPSQASTAPTELSHYHNHHAPEPEPGEFDVLETDEDDDDDNEDDEGMDEDDDDRSRRWELASGHSTSVPASVYEDELAYGRRYHGYRKGRYPIPNDEPERRREETIHAVMLQLMGGHLFYANTGSHPQKIIDIGTGTGNWAIDVADQYPSASVIGTDLSPIQPPWVPINVRMFIEDCEEPEWLHGSNYDLVHLRQVAGVLRNLDGLLGKAYPHVKAGGWVEFHEIIPDILCDDGTMAEDDPLRTFTEMTKQGMHKFGFKSIEVGDLEDALDRAGFTNIHCITKKVPISTWPSDRHLRAMGFFMKAAVQDSLESFAAKPLAALNISEEDRRSLLDQARKSLEDTSIHRYFNFYFCYGQKL